MDGSPTRPLPPPAPSFISLPTAVAAVVGIIGACLYGHWVLPLARGQALVLWGLGLAMAVVTVVTTELRCRAAMSTWRKISDGSADETQHALRRAVAELHAMPGKILRSRMQNWLLAGVVMSAVLVAVNVTSGFVVTVRVLLFTAIYGPWMGLLGHHGLVRRTRELIDDVARRGLKPEEVLSSASTKTLSLRAQIVLLAGIGAGAPLLLLADAASVLVQKESDALASFSDAAERLAHAQAFATDARWAMVVFAAFALTCVVAIAWLAGDTMEQPLRRLAIEAQQLSSGKLLRVRAVVGDGDVMRLSGAFLEVQRHLGGVLTELRSAGSSIGDALTQIASTSTGYQAGVAAQSTSLAQTASSTEELARSGRTISEHAAQVAEIARRTLTSAQEAQGRAGAFSESVERMQMGNAAIHQAVMELNGRVGQIGRIAEFIHNVADRSDVLALNAELEGVKAGEVGESFSLVASEMRRMAENVTRSTREIEQLLDQVREATRGAVSAVEGGVKLTESGGSLMHEVSIHLTLILQLAQKTTEAIEAISVSIQQQQSGTDQLAEAMVGLMGVTQQTKNATDTVLNANADLARVSTTLKATVEKFELS